MTQHLPPMCLIKSRSLPRAPSHFFPFNTLPFLRYIAFFISLLPRFTTSFTSPSQLNAVPKIHTGGWRGGGSSNIIILTCARGGLCGHEGC